MPLTELKDLLQNKRKEFRLKSLKKGFGFGSVNLSVLYVASGLEKQFSSISASCAHLRSEGTVINPTTITKYLYSGKAYKGYIFKKF